MIADSAFLIFLVLFVLRFAQLQRIDSASVQVARQGDAEAGPTVGIDDINFTLMVLDDSVTDRQAQTGTFLFGGEEGVELCCASFLLESRHRCR